MINYRHRIVCATIGITLFVAGIYLFPLYTTSYFSDPEYYALVTSRMSSPTVSPIPKEELEKFQVVVNASLYVFSAYLDYRGTIRILGLKLLHSYSPLIKCQVWLDSPRGPSTTPLVVEATLENIPEHHGRKYTACYILCRIPTHHIPLRVSIISENDGNSFATLSVQTDYTWSANFVACIPALHSNYNNAFDLVEMIEFNRILGAERFIFYNYSIGPNVDKVLRHYQAKGLAEVINWSLPVDKKDIHYFGQLISMNDCVYRNRHKSRFVVLTDVDEFIIPEGNNTSWRQLIFRRKRVSPKATAFQFKNVFFGKGSATKHDRNKFQFSDKADKYKSIVLRNVIKEDKFYNYDIRSKNIVDPLGVETVGIHNIWKSLGQVDRVPTSESYLHHYRAIGPNSIKKIHDDSLVKKFGARLIQRLEAAWHEIDLTSLSNNTFLGKTKL